MDLRKLKKLIDLVEESGIAELEVTEGEEKVRIVKTGRPVADTSVVIPAAVAVPAASAAIPTPVAAPAVTAPAAPEGHVLKSPMVGMFYRAASPEAKPFVEIGDTVRKGQPICIIEAMKLMNEINAEIEGEVVKVHVENGQAVQYGERLFAVRPS